MTKPFLVFAAEARDEAAQRFVDWLCAHVLRTAQGADDGESKDDPSDRLWLGRLAPASVAASSGRDARLERLESCEIGFRLLPRQAGPWRIKATIDLKLWRKDKDKTWRKLTIPPIAIEVSTTPGPVQSYARDALTKHLRDATGIQWFSAEIQSGSQKDWRGRDVATFTYVNTSDEDGCKPFDSCFYEVAMQLEGLETDPFELETLEESFRFDRRVPAYGINCGLRADAGRFITVDTPVYDRQRPVYWGAESVPPPLDFVSLSRDPLPAAREVARAHSEWGARNWDKAILEKRASTEGWADEMLGAAMTAVDEFREENLRIARGVELLATNERLARAFRLMNE